MPSNTVALQRDGRRRQAQSPASLCSTGLAYATVAQAARRQQAKQCSFPDESAADVYDEKPHHTIALAAQCDEKRIRDLEREIHSMRERAEYRENEIDSLKSSLNLLTDENSRLLRYIDQVTVVSDDLGVRLNAARDALNATEAQHRILVDSFVEQREERRAEVATLNTYLEALALRTQAVDDSLSNMQQKLVRCMEEKQTIEQRAADAVGARRAVETALESLQSIVVTREQELGSLHQSHSGLMLGLTLLLAAYQARQAKWLDTATKLKTLNDWLAMVDEGLTFRQLLVGGRSIGQPVNDVGPSDADGPGDTVAFTSSRLKDSRDWPPSMLLLETVTL